MIEPVRRLIDGQWRWCRPETNDVVTLQDLLDELDEEPAPAPSPTNSVKNEQPLEDASAGVANTQSALPINSIDRKHLADAGGATKTTASAVPEQALALLDNVVADEKEEDEDDDPAADPPCHQAESSHKGSRKSLYAYNRSVIIRRHFQPCCNLQGHACKPTEFKGRGKRCGCKKDTLKKRCKRGDAWLDHNKVWQYAHCLGEGMTPEEADVAVWGGPHTILGGVLDKMDKKDYIIPTSGPARHATSCCLSNLEDAAALI
ncbi:hypothetical protein PHSY_002074 [Pseudozyma hubeiensis SY62]|uniref:Uncharacterized protein n=1 Tax=Pseudozyma hubeiensis (strain SY62) TaxID=1305764 RepID=R9P0F0_PSEHS|nr:hypothetical protein PHSY_002074 [Pseudozyma hubeiensis SY62]GAC94502.1 hypothetical protein PHSY_002074 [Pseudozyma hubeiensis SY62]